MSISQDIKKTKAIFVLGMHRSGTSALTGTLYQLGFELGKNLMGGNKFNKKGYWENLQAVALNDRIFSLLERSWFDYRPLPENWTKMPALASVTREIRQFISAEFSNSVLWAVKDPRLCRLLPVWQESLPTSTPDVHHLICIRHPLEVAQSISRRDRIPVEYALLLWLVYNLEALTYTNAFSRSIITYNDLLTNWRETLLPILETFGINAQTSSRQESLIDEFLSAELKHQEPDDIASEQSEIATLAVSLYETLKDHNTEISTSFADDINARLKNYLATNAVLLEDIRQLCATSQLLLRRTEDISELLLHLARISARKLKNLLGAGS